MSGILHQIRVKLLGSDGLSSVLKNATSSVEKFKKAAEQMKSVGVKMMGVGTAIGGVGVVAGHAFVETQAAMRPLKSLLVGTAGEIEGRYASAMRSARDWTSRHVNSMEDWGAAAVPMMKTLKDVDRAATGTGIALKLATAASADAAQASLVLAASYENFGDKSRGMQEEMTHLGDQITATMQAFNIVDLTQFQQGFRKSGLAAKNLGIDTAQVFAVLGQFNNLQLPGREVGASFTQMALKMRDASRQLGFGLAENASGGLDLLGTLDMLKGKFGESASWTESFQEKMKKAFGDQVFEKVSYLVDNLDGVRAGLARITGSAGLVDRVAKTIDEGLGGSIRILKNNLGNLMDAVFEPMAPVVRRVAVQIGGAVNSLRLFTEEHPGLVKIAGTLGLISSSVLLLGGGTLYLAGTFAGSVGSILKMTAAVSKAGGMLAVLKTGILTVGRALLGLFLNPVGLVILGVAALAAGIYLLYRKSETFRDLVHGVGAALKSVFMPVLVQVAYGAGFVAGTLIKAWRSVQAYTASVWPMVAGVLSSVATVIRAVLLPTISFLTGYLTFAWGAIKVVTRAAWEFIKLSVVTSFSVVVNVVRIGWAVVSGVFKAALQVLTGDWSGAWETIKGTLATVWAGIKGIFSAIAGWFTGLGSIFYDAGVGLIGALKDGILASWNTLKSGVIGIGEKIREYLPFSDARKGPLADLTASGKALGATFAGGMKEARALPIAQAEGMASGVAEAAIPDLALAAARPSVHNTTTNHSRAIDRGAVSINIHCDSADLASRLEDELTDLFARLTRQWGDANA